MFTNKQGTGTCCFHWRSWVQMYTMFITSSRTGLLDNLVQGTKAFPSFYKSVQSTYHI